MIKLLFGYHTEDLRKCFKTMRRNSTKINPNKFMFGVASGKFLGYMVSARGIEANPEKIQASINMKASKCIRDIQKLTGRLAAPRRFIFKFAEKALPFFEVLRGPRTLSWAPIAREF